MRLRRSQPEGVQMVQTASVHTNAPLYGSAVSVVSVGCTPSLRMSDTPRSDFARNASMKGRYRCRAGWTKTGSPRAAKGLRLVECRRVTQLCAGVAVASLTALIEIPQ